MYRALVSKAYHNKIGILIRKPLKKPGVLITKVSTLVKARVRVRGSRSGAKNPEAVLKPKMHLPSLYVYSGSFKVFLSRNALEPSWEEKLQLVSLH